MSINVFEELNKFSDIKYVDSTHEYRLNGVRQTSVTTFIGEFKQKFETEKVAKAYAIYAAPPRKVHACVDCVPSLAFGSKSGS